MDKYCGNRKWIIWMSIFIAIILEQIPWPDQFMYYRPTWLALILIYWVMALPHRVSIGIGFFLGILMDSIQSSALGVHALAYSIISYLVSYKHQIFRNVALWQQSLIISVLSVLMNFIIFLAEFFESLALFHPAIFWNCLINSILWPWMFLFLRKVRRQFLVC
ncbi:MAG: rod shape-determining protein MreD [Candidatus Arsenophonus melophagi]|nr:rod shape-determining protein MreD [Candidatus Arsenophonus melophagi]